MGDERGSTTAGRTLRGWSRWWASWWPFALAWPAAMVLFVGASLLGQRLRSPLPVVALFPHAAAVATAGMDVKEFVLALLLGQWPAYALVARLAARRQRQGAGSIGIAAVHLVSALLGSPPSWGPSLARYERELADSAGPGAQACGVISFDEERAGAYRCAHAALAERRPFWVAFRVMGIDSTIYEGLVSRPPEEATRVVWDSDIYGGFNLVPIRRVSKSACEAPSLGSAENPRIDCREHR